MWLAPVLAGTGQAFLLQVLSEGELDMAARLLVLLAGLSAVIAALFTLIRGPVREVQYSEAIAHYSKQVAFPGVSPPLPGDAPIHAIDQHLRRGDKYLLTPVFLWVSTLILFGAADIAVYLAT
jgi:hypothetical protein